MIDEKKLIEDLKVQFDALYREDGELIYSDHVIIGDDVDAIIKLANSQPQVGDWIPVSERPPKETGNYLVTSKGSTWVANWFNGTWWGIEKKCRWTDVEAWQPLPEPYKESEEE